MPGLQAGRLTTCAFLYLLGTANALSLNRFYAVNALSLSLNVDRVESKRLLSAASRRMATFQIAITGDLAYYQRPGYTTW